MFFCIYSHRILLQNILEPCPQVLFECLVDLWCSARLIFRVVSRSNKSLPNLLVGIRCAWCWSSIGNSSRSTRWCSFSFADHVHKSTKHKLLHSINNYDMWHVPYLTKNSNKMSFHMKSIEVHRVLITGQEPSRVLDPLWPKKTEVLYAQFA